MKIAITGGAGFIGSHLAHACAERGDTVLIIDDLSTGRLARLNKLAYHQLKIGDFSSDAAIASVRRFNPDITFHLAANPSVPYSDLHTAKTSETNLHGFVKFLEGTWSCTGKLVLASTSAIYGAGNGSLFETETQSPQPQSSYALQKLQCEQWLDLWNRTRSFDSTALRLFNVYGPSQNNEGAYVTVIAKWLRAIAERKPLVIEGDGEQSRDFVHVSDVVNAFLAAGSQKNLPPVLNIGSGTTTSLNDLLKIVEAHCPTLTTKNITARNNDVKKTRANITRATNALDWKPAVSLIDGVGELCQKLVN